MESIAITDMPAKQPHKGEAVEKRLQSVETLIGKHDENIQRLHSVETWIKKHEQNATAMLEALVELHLLMPLQTVTCSHICLHSGNLNAEQRQTTHEKLQARERNIRESMKTLSEKCKR